MHFNRLLILSLSLMLYFINVFACYRHPTTFPDGPPSVPPTLIHLGCFFQSLGQMSLIPNLDLLRSVGKGDVG